MFVEVKKVAALTCLLSLAGLALGAVIPKIRPCKSSVPKGSELTSSFWLVIFRKDEEPAPRLRFGSQVRSNAV
jgi:hypothetical protein